MDCTPILLHTALFCDLSPDTIAQTLLPNGKIHDYCENECAILLNEKVDRVGIVLQGMLYAMQTFPDGNYSLMDKIMPSNEVGAEFLCTNSKRSPYSVLAAVPSRVLFFPSRIFLEPGVLPETDRLAVIDRLLTLLSRGNMKKYYRIAILSQNSLRDRIVTYLSMRARRLGATSFTIPFSREEMASYLCVNRSALSHELSKMKRDGLIRFEKNRFTLLTWDPKSL